MAGLDPAGPPRPSTPKWRLSLGSTKGVDGPVKPGHDGVEESGPASFGITFGFENGDRLSVFSDIGQYESGHITTPAGTFTVF